MKGSLLDLERLAVEIRGLKSWHPLYKVLKRELSALGYWKNKKRGNPAMGFRKLRERQQAKLRQMFKD